MSSFSRPKVWRASSLITVGIAGLLFGLGASRSHAQQEPNRQLVQANSPNARRIALVIGNGGYTNAPPLKNPPNDARDMAATLKALGFEVTSGINVNQREMKRLIREFGQKLKTGGNGLFYYAGHGVQSKGRNYLIPVEADIQSEIEAEDAGVDVSLVLGYMDDAQNGLNIVILDACRNNPFARSFRSAASGLAQVDAPTGTLIAYATAPGRVASDGTGQNGLYTSELLKQMRVSGLSATELFMRVRAEVMKQTGNKQVPWEASSLVGSFYFNRPPKNTAAAGNNAGPIRPSEATKEEALWEAVRDSDEPRDFRDYLTKYPNGVYADAAQVKLRRLDVATTGSSNSKLTNSQPSNTNDQVLLDKVMNPTFAKDYVDKSVRVKARFIGSGQTQGWLFSTIPAKVTEGKVAFRVSSLQQIIGPEAPFGSVPPHVFIDKEKSDIVFELKGGDFILLTGSTVVGRQGAFIQVVFVATSIEKIN